MEIHKPSKKQAILFFLFALLLAGGVIAWTFFINTGMLVAEGEAPFWIRAGGKNILCKNSPCSVKFSPRAYDITLQKEGFRDDAQHTTIQRWSETKIAAHFEFIPVLAERGDLILPFESAPLKTPFIGMKKFENFPKDVKDAVFSASGNFAILKLGKERYEYDVQKHEVSEINIPLTAPIAWVGEKIASLEENGEKQTIFLSDVFGKREAHVSFLRPLKNSVMLGSPSGEKLLIHDEDTKAFYLIDMEKKSRDRVDELGGDTTVSHWVGKYLIISEGGKIFAFHADTFGKTELNANDPENIVEIAPDAMVFFSLKKQDSGKSNLSQTLEEAVEAAKKETLSEKPLSAPPGATLFLTEFSAANNTLKTLAEIPIKPDETIHRLTFDAKSGNLFFEKNKKIYEVRLKAN